MSDQTSVQQRLSREAAAARVAQARLAGEAQRRAALHGLGAADQNPRIKAQLEQNRETKRALADLKKGGDVDRTPEALAVAARMRAARLRVEGRTGNTNEIGAYALATDAQTVAEVSRSQMGHFVKAATVALDGTPELGKAKEAAAMAREKAEGLADAAAQHDKFQSFLNSFPTAPVVADAPLQSGPVELSNEQIVQMEVGRNMILAAMGQAPNGPVKARLLAGAAAAIAVSKNVQQNAVAEGQTPAAQQEAAAIQRYADQQVEDYAGDAFMEALTGAHKGKTLLTSLMAGLGHEQTYSGPELALQFGIQLGAPTSGGNP